MDCEPEGFKLRHRLTGGYVRFLRSTFVLIGLTALAGCGSLPADGPSAADVEKHAQVEKHPVYALINLDYHVAEIVAADATSSAAGLKGASSDAPDNLIGKGDILSISIFEEGSAGLFSHVNTPALAGEASIGAAVASGQDTLPRVLVDDAGRITLPFAGSIPVEGITPLEAADRIRRALLRRTVNPQVLVGVVTSARNSVSILGEVRNAGRFPISDNSDRLLDVVAEAGGPTHPARDIRVELVRGDSTLTASLASLMEDAQENIRLAPRDQIRLMLQERKFSTLGALGRVTENSIVDDHLTLASAISRDGGLDTNSANDAAVFLFRFERLSTVQALGLAPTATAKGTPVIYRLNMHDPNGYFVAQAFEIQPGDILYVPRASSVPLRKFFDLVNLLTQVTYTAAVTSGAP